MLDLNQCIQLGNVPLSPVAWTAVAVIILIALADALVGFVGYHHRHLA